jgi:hypothetical protein
MEKVAHVVLLGALCVVGGLLLRDAGVFSTVVSEGNMVPAVRVGKRFALSGKNWDSARPTIVIALASWCPHCKASVGFYRAVVKANESAEPPARLLVVSAEPPETTRRFLTENGVVVESVRQSGLDEIGVRGTPTVVVVGGDGIIRKVLFGEISGAQQTEFLRSVEDRDWDTP